MPRVRYAAPTRRMFAPLGSAERARNASRSSGSSDSTFGATPLRGFAATDSRRTFLMYVSSESAGAPAIPRAGWEDAHAVESAAAPRIEHKNSDRHPASVATNCAVAG